MGIDVHHWALNPQHRLAYPTARVGRICDCPRTGASASSQSRQGIQKLHVRLSTGLGGTRAAVAEGLLTPSCYSAISKACNSIKSFVEIRSLLCRSHSMNTESKLELDARQQNQNETWEPHL